MFRMLTSPHVPYLAMTILHSLWQGALIGLALVAVLRMLPARDSQTRYLASVCALVLLFTAALATCGWLEIRAGEPVDGRLGSTDTQEATPAVPFNWERILVAIWGIGVGVMLLRLAVSFCQIKRLTLSSYEPDADLVQRLTRIARKCSLSKTITILQNDTLSSAAVIGLFKPILFLPTSMVSGLSASQLEAVVAHEIAHIRRYDPLVNFLQMLVEAMLFFNPAVWWIGHQIRVEREACCDAAGVQATGDAELYSETLAVWASVMSDFAGGATPAASLAFAKKQPSVLLDRVRRVLFPQFVPRARFSPISTAILFAVGIGLLGTLWKGTQVAVVFANELIPHSQVVERLTEVRDEYDGQPLAIIPSRLPQGPMTVHVTVVTEDGKPTTSQLRTSYMTYKKRGGSVNSRCSSGPSIEAGQSELSFEVDEGWAHLLFTAEGYAPAAFRDVQPAKDGIAQVKLTLRRGHESAIHIVNKAGEPIPNAAVKVNYELSYKVEEQTSKGTKTSHGNRTGTPAGKTSTDENGLASLAHTTSEPLFGLKVSAEGFEEQSLNAIGFQPDTPLQIVMQRAMPITGVVSDGNGNPIGNANVHILRRYRTTGNHTESRSGSGGAFTKREFGEVAAITTNDGEFAIGRLASDWTYDFVVDAGDHGIRTLFGVRPGDEQQLIQVDGPISLSGVITGDLERLRKEDDIELGYGVSIVSESRSDGDASGVLKLDVVNGQARFELENVVPGIYDFFPRDAPLGTDYFERALKVEQSKKDLHIEIGAKKEHPTDVTSERRVRLTFRSAEEAAPFRGRISVSSRRAGDNMRAHFERPVEVIDSVAEFVVNAPTKMDIELMDAPGFSFREGMHEEPIEVAAGHADFMEELTVYPAGAVFGQISAPWIAEATWTGVTGWLDYGNRSSTVSDQADSEGKFYLSPVPYGSKLRLIARCGAYCQALRATELTANNPHLELNVSMEDSPALTGKLLDFEGDPIRGKAVSLKVFTSKYQDFWIGSATTDADGAFSFGPVNLEAGEHFLEIKSKQDFAQKFVKVKSTEKPMLVSLEQGLVIEGVLTDIDTGEVIADAEVYAMPESFQMRAVHGFEAESKTDEAGRFKFSNLGNNTYRIGTRVLHGRVIAGELAKAGSLDIVVGLTRKASKPPVVPTEIPPTH